MVGAQLQNSCIIWLNIQNVKKKKVYRMYKTSPVIQVTRQKSFLDAFSCLYLKYKIYGTEPPGHISLHVYS